MPSCEAHGPDAWCNQCSADLRESLKQLQGEIDENDSRYSTVCVERNELRNQVESLTVRLEETRADNARLVGTVLDLEKARSEDYPPAGGKRQTRGTWW